MALNLELTQIENEYIRENFKKIDANSKFPLFDKPMSFYEIKIPAATTGFKFPHNLNFTPKDAIITSVIGTGVVTINYSSFDATTVNFTTTGTAGDFITIRILIGSIS